MQRILLVVRHGETDWNVANRWQGQSDTPLNDHGRAQAHALAARLRGYALGGIVSSDLSRARETAEIIAAALDIPGVRLDVGLRERSFGCFEGLTGDECQARHAEEWRAWREDHKIPPGGESSEALLARTSSAFERAARETARDDVPGLVVTHGGVIRAIVSAATGTRPPPIRNAELWQMVWDDRVVHAQAVDTDDDDSQAIATEMEVQQPPL
jgi:probable phosphoglycerate mutase